MQKKVKDQKNLVNWIKKKVFDQKVEIKKNFPESFCNVVNK